MQNKKLIITLIVVVVMASLLCAFTACKADPKIDHIEIFSTPKTSYVLGEELDLTDASIIVVYVDKSERQIPVTRDMISSFSSDILGDQYILISYEGETVAFKVTVSRPEVVAAEIIIPDANFNYIVEQPLNLKDCYYKFSFSNGTSLTVPITQDMCSGYDRDKIGTQEVTVTYDLDGTVYKATFNVNVEDRELVGIDVRTIPAQTIYYLGDSVLELTGGELTLKYNSGYSHNVPMKSTDGKDLEGLTYKFDSSAVADSVFVTIMYGGFEAQFTVRIANRDVASYTIVDEEAFLAEHKQYQYRDLDLEGLRLNVVYTNGTGEELVCPTSSIRFSGYDETIAGEQNVVIEFYYGNAKLKTEGSIKINVIERQAIGLEIVDEAVVYQDTAFNIADWTYRLIYNNGLFGDPTQLNNNIVKWNGDIVVDRYSEPGEQTWYLSINENVSTTYTFEVVPLAVDSIEFVNDGAIIAGLNGSVDTSNVTATVTYNNGSTVEGKPVTPDMFTFDNTKTGVVRASVVYHDEYEKGYAVPAENCPYVNVVKKIRKVEFRGEVKVRYIVNESFEPYSIDKTTKEIVNELILDIYYEGEVNSVILRASDRQFADEWSMHSDMPDGSLEFTEPGEHKVYFTHVALDTEAYIIVEVTNRFVGIDGLYVYSEDGLTLAPEGLGNVVEGKEIDLENYCVLVSFEGEERFIELTSDMIDYSSKNTNIGERKVNIYYPDRYTYDSNIERSKIETTVTVNNKSPIGIEIMSMPTNTVYVVKGSGLTFDYTGMVIWLLYDNGTYSKIEDIADEMDERNLDFSGLDNTVGEQTITATYRVDDSSFTAEILVTVIAPEVKELEWSEGKATANVPVGTEISQETFKRIDVSFGGYLRALTSATINIIETDGRRRDNVTLSQIADRLSVEGYEKGNQGRQEVRLVYNGNKSIYLPLTVIVGERVLEKIEVESVNLEGSFMLIQGAEIDCQKYVLKLIFNDTSSYNVPMRAEYINYNADTNPQGYNKDNLDASAPREVTVVYSDGKADPVQTTVVFTILEKSLIKIEVNDIPKRYYIEGEDFEVDNGTLMLYYDNGTTEIHRMIEAGMNDPGQNFYIDNRSFDNSEFGGSAKAQRITVYYRYGGKTLDTSYVIYMRDRRDVAVEYSADNEYEFVYGGAVEPIVGLKGYENYSAGERTKTFGADAYKVEYIPQSTWLTIRREAGVDYTVFPKDAGEYMVVASYEGDGIHNAFEDARHIITINKKKIYVGFVETSGIYGEAVGATRITLGTEKGNPLSDPLSVFVEGDGIGSECFNSQGKTFATVAILADNEGELVKIDGSVIELDIFDISYVDSKGKVVNMSEVSPAGRYTIHINNQIFGKNYETITEKGSYTVHKRKVKVVPEALEYVYGTSVVPPIKFNVSAIEGDIQSGLYGTDTIAGSLSREDRSNNSVGEYAIKVGSLQESNPNYEIVFENAEEAKVTILKRTIYVKTDSVIKIYGEEVVYPNVKFYGDHACTDEDSAFAKGDDLSVFGTIDYISPSEKPLPDKYSEVGMYPIGIRLSGDGVGAGNYNIVYIDGYIQVVARPVLVKADGASKIFGEDDPELTYTATAIEGNAQSGLVTIDGKEDALTGELGRVGGENYGEYVILIGTLCNENYSITFVSAKLTIERKALFVKIEDKYLSKVYDGKKPSVEQENYELMIRNGEGYESYSVKDGEDARKYISISFDGASKEFGQYKVRVSVNNNNYSVAFYDDAEYVFVIEKRLVAIVASDYRDLPDGMEYRGTDYTFTAHINKNDLQHVYNDDGTFATDEHNKPLFDDDTVTLSLSKVKNAGTYTTRVTAITDKNYKLDEANSPAITFTLNPRTIYIGLKCNSATEANTIEREYNNQSAVITAADYTVENTIPGEGNVVFALGIYSGENIVTAKDVRYAEDGVTVVGYDVRIAENTVNPNYVVRLKEAYRFKIVPRKVQIRINDRYLTKVYDGEEPSITSTMFAPANHTTGFDNATVSFTFSRSSNDGMDNATVGTYDVALSCSDKNFAVTAQMNYVYTINRAAVNVTINSSALSKAYDGEDYNIEYAKLTFSAYYGSAPIVRNFAYGVSNENYENFVIKLDNITNAYNALRTLLSSVSFDAGVNSARSKLVEVQEHIENRFGNLISNSAENCFTEENRYNVQSATSTMKAYIDSAIKGIDEGEVDKAIVCFKSAVDVFGVVKTAVERENSYLAFVFGTVGTTGIKDKGIYDVTMYYRDNNRQYTLLNTAPKAEIKERQLRIIIESLSVPYGTRKDNINIPYTIWDMSNGKYIEKGDAIYDYIKESPTIDSDDDILNSRSYNINIGNMRIDDNNYRLDNTMTAKVYVTKATLTVVMNDIENENLFVYGQPIYKTSFSGYVNQYTYLDVGAISENTTDEKERYIIGIAEAYCKANGLSELDLGEKLRVCFGGFAGQDEDLTKIIKNGSLNTHCYVSGDSGLEIFQATSSIDAGKYKWTVEGFVADNYVIKVIPGTLTVSKLKLYATNTGFSGALEKAYGETSVKFSYQAINSPDISEIRVFVPQDNGDINEVPLADMVWQHTVEGETDPLAEGTDAGDTQYSVRFFMGDNYIQNYEVVFEESYQVVVTRAKLKLTVKPSGTNMDITAKYMATPDNYVYVYEGFKNGNTATDLGIAKGGDYAPIINFTRGEGVYYDVGRHTMRDDAVNVAKATAHATNYTIEVTDFVFVVEARKIYASLADVDTWLTDFTGGTGAIVPYKIEITSTKKVTVGDSTNYVPKTAKLKEGNYGKNNFRFEIEMTEEERQNTAFANKLSEMLPSLISKVKLYENPVLESGAEGKNVEYYKGDELYVHNVTVTRNSYTASSNDQSYGTVTAKLSGMSFANNNKNFEFSYKEFKVNTRLKIRGLSASWDGKLLSDDLNKDATKQKMKVTLFYYNNVNVEVDGKDSAVLLYGMPNAIGITKDVNVSYNKKYPLFDKLTELDYEVTYAESGLGGSVSTAVMNVVVTDERANVYSTADSARMSVPTRFYNKQSTVRTNPTLNGANYTTVNNNSTGFVTTTDELTYDTLRMSLRLVETTNGSEFTVVLAGRVDVNGSYVLAMTFDKNVGNSAKVGLYCVGNSLSEVSSITYEIPCENLFDGYSHDLRVRFDNELSYVVAAVDGGSGAIFSVDSLTDFESAKADLRQSSKKFAFKTDMGYAIGTLSLVEQGLYDSTGTFINIASSSKATNSHYVFETEELFFEFNNVLLGDLFGIGEMLPTGYSVAYYVDGKSVDPTLSKVSMQRGSHLVELALYKDGVLVDYDYTVVMVSRAVKSYIYTDNEEVEYVNGSVLRMYTPLANAEFEGDSDYATMDLAARKTFNLYSNINSAYFASTFTLERVAQYNTNDKKAYYDEGEYILYYNLFTDSESGGVDVSSELYRSAYGTDGYTGARLRFVRNQTETDEYGKSATNYTYNVYLDVADGESVREVTVYENLVGGERGVGFEIRLYYDKLGAIGNGIQRLRIRKVGTVEWSNHDIYGIGNATPFIALNGNATRITLSRLEFVENDRTFNDYLIGNEYRMYDGKPVALTAGNKMMLSDGIGSPSYSSYSSLEYEFSVPSATGIVTMALAESSFEGNAVSPIYGAYLKYDLANNKLIFQFRLGDTYSLAQEYALDGQVNPDGIHSIVANLNVANVGSKTCISDGELTRNGVTLTDYGSGKIYYRTVTVTIDDVETEFYLPEYADMNGWLKADGVRYGSDNNNYSGDIEDGVNPPTFLALYNLNSFSASVDMEVSKYTMSIGATGAYSTPAITEAPVI